MVQLFVPNLISKLYIKSTVPVVQDEEVMTKKRFINKPLLDRIMANDISCSSVIPITAINEMMAQQTRISTELVELKTKVAELAEQITVMLTSRASWTS